MSITPSQMLEISRLAGLMSTARCRRLAVQLGHHSPRETKENTEQRVEKSTNELIDYLTTLLEK